MSYYNEHTLPVNTVKQSCSPESMSAITSSFSLLEKTTPTGSGTLFDRITGFSNEKAKEKAKFSGGRRSSNSTEKSYHLDSYSSPTIQPALARTPQRGRLETTVLDVDNVISPKRHNVTDTSSNVSFLDCTITPIKREKARASPATAKKRLERSINTSKTFSLNSSEGEETREQSQEWRAVKDPVSGKMYFYNRLTRVSKWKLPKGAVLRQKRSTNNTSFATAVTDESNKQGSERKDSHVISSPQSSEHTSSQLSSDDTNIVTTATTGDNIKSPQDTTAELLFCLYCGLNCGSLSMLESHLPQCSCFIRMQEPGLLSKQLEIERVLFSLWSKNGSNEQASHTSGNKGLHQSPFKETSVFSSSRGLFQSPFNENTKERRDDEDSYTVSPPKFNIREHKNTNDFCIDKKTCPFCEEALFGGDNFSSHLLICKERKRRRNRRRTPKKHSVVEEFSPRIRAGVRTPGRRMPWE